jgi:hypothetical protein
VKCKRKGGEKNEKEHITHDELAAGVDAVLGSAAGLEELNSEETISTVPAELPSYCHITSPAMREDSLGWAHPVFEDSAVNAVDFYGPCDYDPLGIDAVKTERRIELRGFYGDGE